VREQIKQLMYRDEVMREQIEQLIKDAESIRFRMYDLHKLTGDTPNTPLDNSAVETACLTALLVPSLKRLLIEASI
jgi:hypothetical protein